MIHQGAARYRYWARPATTRAHSAATTGARQRCAAAAIGAGPPAAASCILAPELTPTAYPSAWHIAWRAPPDLVCKEGRGSVAALAVDVEPTVFWDGDAEDFAEQLSRWKQEVGFLDGQHGFVSPVSPSMNGSSGKTVVRHYLKPLGIGVEHATFTDVYPVFLIKEETGGRKKREQGDAIRDEYDSLAARMGFPTCSLPTRIPKAKLPALAASTFGERLIADLSAASAPLIITLGEEVWGTLLAIPPLRARPPRASFRDLYSDAYGAVGSLTVNDREVAWLPLVHPGLLKGKLDPAASVAPGRRSLDGWGTFHARWAAARQAEGTCTPPAR
jgi:hypothetical protein